MLHTTQAAHATHATPAIKTSLTNALNILKNISIGITGLLVLVTLPLYGYKVYEKLDYTDFEVYYRAAQRVKELQWHQIYQLQDGASPFRYPPLFLPFFRPFAELTLGQAKLVWYGLQFFSFGVGFYLIYLCIKRIGRKRQENAIWITSLGILFILRYCLDTFTIGQVSSLMFLGFCTGLYGFLTRRSSLGSIGLLFPTLFKIGPGILYGTYLSSRPVERKKAWSTAFFTFLFLLISSSLWLMWAGAPSLKLLWQEWSKIVAADSSYFDAAHYGSQSLKSFLLRSVKRGWLTSEVEAFLHLSLAFLTCGGALLFWTARRPKSLLGRGHFFSLGIFLYIWFMPETFKYSLTPLAIPVVLLLSTHSKTRLTWTAIISGFLFLSFSGKDIVGDFLFFEIQYESIPFFTTLLLGLATLQQAIQESRLSSTVKALRGSKPQSLGPWEKPPQSVRSLKTSLLVPIQFDAGQTPCPNETYLNLIGWLKKWKDTLHECCSESFEILLIPYGDRQSETHPLYQELKQLSQSFSCFKLIHESNNSVHHVGEALRLGFLASLGNTLLFCQILQPCDPAFIRDTLQELASGYDLVRGNRRLSQSQFKIPVRFLSLVYGRHRLGLLLNQILRVFFPLQTSDLFSGTLGLSFRFAQTAFTLQSSRTFMFHLELSLATVIYNFREKDIPLKITLLQEKAVSQVFSETFLIARELPSLYLRFKRGAYNPLPTFTGITADDWGLSPGVNQGILKLAKLGIVRRVSMMANCAYVEEGLQELQSIPEVQLGLHFNLTYGKEYPTPGQVLLSWLDPRSSNRAPLKNKIRMDLNSQLERLERLGVTVQYLDGHHHIHLVPGLLNALSDILVQKKITIVRFPIDYSLSLSRQFPIVVLAIIARLLTRALPFQTLPCRYPNSLLFKDPGSLRAQLQKYPSHAEIIVHPAEVDDLNQLEIPDSYTSGRVTEFLALRMLGTR